MPRAESVDRELRERLRRHLWVLMHENKLNAQKLSEQIGSSSGTVADYLNGVKTIGLDFMVKMHRTFHVSADYLVDQDPEIPKALLALVEQGQVGPPGQSPARRHGSGR
jgi:transcriptional regulator with XRE-family HTH domain